MKNGLVKSFDYVGDPADVFRLFTAEPHLFFLDSSKHDNDNGRYSFMGFDPFEVCAGHDRSFLDGLKERYSLFREVSTDAPTPLPTGIVGFLSYELGLKQEGLPVMPGRGPQCPDGFFGFYDRVLTFDHYANKLYITSTGLPETGPSGSARARERLDQVLDKLKALSRPGHGLPQRSRRWGGFKALELSGNFTEEQYIQTVKRAKEYIGRGDIYQVNLSQRFDMFRRDLSSPPAQIYEILREISPAYFCGYLDTGDLQVLSNSPERFIQLRGNRVQTRPMKGTRPRGKTAREDDLLKADLVESRKDKAELLMITDLMRNDLGRVCRYGSVNVRQLRSIEEYSTVYQATSTVEGVLQDGKDGFDVLKACFPGGSITGCPKIRAMEIINELEPDPRGPYTGSMGYMSFAGEMDFNILIRTMVTDRERLTFHAGGGIVADSDPAVEYQETLVKARAIQQCLAQVVRQKAIEV